MTRDPLKIVGIALAAVIVAKVLGQPYLPGFFVDLLNLAAFLGGAAVVILAMMRMNGRL